ncbi:MAG: DUF2254 domain-containing protein [Porticoccaceae bacterium]|nr:DUF2254 domain-containing protein [Porticoccaceae bacterium]
MNDRLRLLFHRIGEQLWIKPLLMCVLSILGIFLAKAADTTKIGAYVPEIRHDSIEALLSTISASMLIIATFAVGSMVTSYASASSKATPRSFALIIADDVSQNALSIFIGSFIYSLVGLIALENGYFERGGRFALFVLTLLVFTLVILTFVRWLDSIARLGRIQTTIDTVEKATRHALTRRRETPRLQGAATGLRHEQLTPVFTQNIGYLQCIDVACLQKYAEKHQLRMRIVCLPGTFCTPDRPLVYVWAEADTPPTVLGNLDEETLSKAFIVDIERAFTDDPRFGLIVLSEIASKALSPAINDPGTAITVIGSMVRLLTEWSNVLETSAQPVKYDRIEVPELSSDDMFDDAFTAIARYGAGTVEVAVRLQKALHSLAVAGDKRFKEAALHQARMALTRSESALELEEERTAVKAATTATW